MDIEISDSSTVVAEGGVVQAQVFWTFEGAPWILTTLNGTQGEITEEKLMEHAREMAGLTMEDVQAYLAEFGELPFDRQHPMRCWRKGSDGVWSSFFDIGCTEPCTREEWLDRLRQARATSAEGGGLDPQTN